MIDDDGNDGSDDDDEDEEGEGNSNNRYLDALFSNHLFEIVPKIAFYI